MAEAQELKKKLSVFSADPNLMRKGIRLNDVGVLPDKVKNYPLSVQEIYREAYNANLDRFGSVEFAFKAAWKCLQTAARRLERLRQEKSDGYDRDERLLVATDRFKRARKPRVQIVVL